MSTPDPYAASVQEAYSLAQQGDREGALALLYSVVSAVPDHRNAWWLIALYAPREDQQRQALRRVLTLDPDFGPAREMAARFGEFEMPGQPYPAPQGQPAPAPADSYAFPPDSPPPARDYVSHPDQYPAAAHDRHPARDQYAPPEPAPYAVERRPTEPALEPYYPERTDKPKRAEDYQRPAGQVQPFLVLNGGCASGCFSSVLTTLIFAVLAFLILRDSVGAALQSVGRLAPGEGVSASLIPAIMVTGLLQVLRTTPIAIPINLGTLIPGFDPSMLPALPTSNQIFSEAMSGLWQSMGYPAQTGDLIIGQMSTVGSQVGSLSWILPLLFFGGWIVLAFFLVFARARSIRFLHWLLSTVGLWILGSVAYALALLLYRLLGGGIV